MGKHGIALSIVGNPPGMEEYSDLDMQQMIGRAGRPQYDTHGQVVVSGA